MSEEIDFTENNKTEIHSLDLSPNSASNTCPKNESSNSLHSDQSIQKDSSTAVNPYACPQTPNFVGHYFRHPFNEPILPIQMLGQSYGYNQRMFRPLIVNPQNFIQPVPSSQSTATSVPNPNNDSIVGIEKTYICRLCSLFQTKDVDHIRDHLTLHSPKSRPFVCQICSKSYQFRCLWRNHMIGHMIIKIKNTPKPTEQHTMERDTNRKKCTEKDMNCELSSAEPDLDQHMEIKCKTHPFKCLECEYQTDTNAKIIRHELTHTRDRPFGCIECNSTFSYCGSLKGHLIRVHKIRDFLIKCLYCSDYESKNFGLLKTHIQRVHKNQSFGYSIFKLI